MAKLTSYARRTRIAPALSKLALLPQWEKCRESNVGHNSPVKAAQRYGVKRAGRRTVRDELGEYLAMFENLGEVEQASEVRHTLVMRYIDRTHFTRYGKASAIFREVLER